MSLLSPKMLLVNVLALHALFFAVQAATDDDPTPPSPAGEHPAGSATAGSPTPDAPPEAVADEALAADAEAPGPPAEPLTPLAAVAAQAAPPIQRPGALRLQALYEDEGKLLADLGNDWVGELTTDLPLQAAATRILNRARVPFGAVVVLDVATGNVLAMADRYDEHHAAAPKLSKDGPPHLALRAVAPAASVFKIVTTVGLLETGLSPNKTYPFVPAKRRVYEAQLGAVGKGAPQSDVGDALAKSNNGFFARMADLQLAREDMQAIARRFGFNQVVPFPLLTEASTARVPRNKLERARMAAGFWHTHLTPLHAALIATAVAGDGTLPRPRLVGRLRSPDGRLVDAPEQPPFATAMTPKQALLVREMMARTTKSGTLRRVWRKWPKSLRDVTVGAKTGTLARRDPYTAYTWFVGFAPVDNPQIAIAVVVGNGELWWQRGADVGRDVLAWYFTQQAKGAAAKPSQADDPTATAAAR